jgi:AhpD family alkylhydroperoxidase
VLTSALTRCGGSAATNTGARVGREEVQMVVPSRVAASVVQRQVKHVTPVPVAAATGLVRRVYDQIAQEMRLVIPPAQLHSPTPALLAAYWTLMREPLLPGPAVDRATKEAVAAAVSVANVCPYCAEMHGVSLYDLSTEHDAEAVTGDRVSEVADPRLRQAADWARHAHLHDARVAVPATDAAAHAELVGVLVSMHYLSRMVNVFLSPFLLPPGLGPRARRRFKQGMSWMLRPTLRDPREPGRSVDLLPPAATPADAGWTAGNPWISAGFARAAAAFEEAGERSLAPAVRRVVLDCLDGWRGEEPGLSSSWCERLVAGLPPGDAAAGRLALLTCLASYQVDGHTIGAYRDHHPGDVDLLNTVAWASFATARRIGARLAPG